MGRLLAVAESPKDEGRTSRPGIKINWQPRSAINSSSSFPTFAHLPQHLIEMLAGKHSFRLTDQVDHHRITVIVGDLTSETAAIEHAIAERNLPPPPPPQSDEFSATGGHQWRLSVAALSLNSQSHQTLIVQILSRSHDKTQDKQPFSFRVSPESNNEWAQTITHLPFSFFCPTKLDTFIQRILQLSTGPRELHHRAYLNRSSKRKKENRSVKSGQSITAFRPLLFC